MPCELFTDEEGGYICGENPANRLPDRYAQTVAQIATQDLSPLEHFTLLARAALTERMDLHNEDPHVQQWLTVLTDLFCADIQTGSAFLKDVCTEDEFIWISEIVDAIAKQCPDSAFADALKAVAAKYADACKLFNLNGYIDKALQTIAKA